MLHYDMATFRKSDKHQETICIKQKLKKAIWQDIYYILSNGKLLNIYYYMNDMNSGMKTTIADFQVI